MLKQESPYNPLDKKNLGISVADALLARPMDALPPQEQFMGAGIYAIYFQHAGEQEKSSKVPRTPSPSEILSRDQICS